MSFFAPLRRAAAPVPATRMEVVVHGGSPGVMAKGQSELILSDEPTGAVSGGHELLRTEQPRRRQEPAGHPPCAPVRAESQRSALDAEAVFDENIQIDLDLVTLLSNEGVLAANVEQRKLLCYLSDARLVVANGYLYSPHVMSYVTLLQRRGTGFTVCYTSLRRITDIYKAAGGGAERAHGKSATRTEAETVAFKVISEAVRSRASDIHIRVGHAHAQVLFRVDGDLVPFHEYDPEFGMRLVRTYYQVLADISGETFKETQRLDARIGDPAKLPPGLNGVRIASTPTDERNLMVLRMLYDMTGQSLDLSELGFDRPHCDQLDQLQDLPIGLNIISGPTGSGKSTTLQRTLRGAIQKFEGRKHVITVEDPPEYPIPGAVQTPVGNSATQKQREEQFIAAISSAMRLDPDVIMIGEVRDLPSAELALRAATTGHQVWTTLHANNALHIVDRMVNMGMDPDMLLDHSVLTGLISQRLIKRLCPHCRRPLRDHLQSFDSRTLERFKRAAGRQFADLFITGPGCDKCRGGTAGRTVVAEVVLPDARLCQMLRDGKRLEAREHWLRDMGGRSFLQHTIGKVQEGLVDPVMAEHVVGPLRTDADALAANSMAGAGHGGDAGTAA